MPCQRWCAIPLYNLPWAGETLTRSPPTNSPWIGNWRRWFGRSRIARPLGGVLGVALWPGIRWDPQSSIKTCLPYS
jgi:hypothetical protein